MKLTHHMMDSRTQAKSRWVDQRRVEQAAVGSPTRGAAEGGPGVVSGMTSLSVVEVMGLGSSIQGVAWTATLQSLHVPISMSLAASWMMYSFPA